MKWSRQIELQGLKIPDNYNLIQLREQHLILNLKITFQMDTKTEGKEQIWMTRMLCNTSLRQALK